MKNAFKKINLMLILTALISLMSVTANACPGSNEDEDKGGSTVCEMEKLLEPAPQSIQLACNADGSPSECDKVKVKKLYEPLYPIQLV